ncbi:MAG TPA: PrgI family protein [Ktedonobacteraceae bacterium]|nr:PrgI family protein [Ktedonobacteraceae bacterium]
MKYKHKIPNHLEVEDHLIAGLSARQLLLIGAGLALGYLVWSNLSLLSATRWGLLLSVVIALFPALLGAGAAFFRPASRGLEEWAIVGFVTLLQPKQYLWTALPDEPERATEKQAELDTSAHEEEENE